MKTTAISFAIIMMSAMIYGQPNPQFSQEEMSIYDYLRVQMNFNGENTGYFLPGTEVIAFVINPNGELTDFRVINSISTDIDNEMIRALKETSGKWQPGFRDGNPVAMDQEVALAFMPHNYDFVSEAKSNLARGNRLLSSNPKRALKYYDNAYRLLPYNESILIARSLCKYKLGDMQGAIRDNNRIIALNGNQNGQDGVTDQLNLSENLIGYGQ